MFKRELFMLTLTRLKLTTVQHDCFSLQEKENLIQHEEKLKKKMLHFVSN